MSHILTKNEGVKKAIVVGDAGLYEVYETSNDSGIRVTAGLMGLAPFVNVQLPVEKSKQATALFKKLVGVLGSGRTCVDIEKITADAPEEQEEPAAEVESDAESSE